MFYTFKANAINTGNLTIGERKTVSLHVDGKPLRAGDLRCGDVVTFDRETGEVIGICETHDVPPGE